MAKKFHSVFKKLFASVMLALVLFALAMITLLQLVHDNSNATRSHVMASQIMIQVEPFLHELDTSLMEKNRLQSRFMLALIKKSLDVFDQSLDAKMALYSPDGHLLIQTDDSDMPKQKPPEPSWMARTFPAFAGTHANEVQIASHSGYVLLYEPRNMANRSVIYAVLNLFTGTLLLLAIMAVVLWWIAHSMTWRINQMSHQIRQLGNGHFSVRVAVKGNDEITMLAQGFNQAAQKIEQLINANNLLLAHASHELRTPITRIRLQIEMMDMLTNELSPDKKEKFDKRAAAVNRDLTGLNDLVESILLVSRLDAGHALQQVEKLDIYDLIYQEQQHYPEATLIGEHVAIEGQPRLLTHLIRNLLNNAVLHGIPPVNIYIYGVEYPEQANIIPDELLTLANHHSEKDSLVTTATNAYSEPNTLNKDLDIDNNDTEHQAEPTEILDNSVTEDANDANDTNLKKESIFRKRLKKSKDDAQPPIRFVAISVIDQGEGIPLEKRQDIFSPFVRLKQDKKGSGLGLSLVAQIVEAHKGHILTDTWQGKTRFLVVLPVHQPTLNPTD